MKLDKLHIVVTGGAGFIGSSLVGELAKNNSVTVIDNLSVGRKENIDEVAQGRHVRLIKADVRQARTMEKALVGCDVVFHLAVQCIRRSFKDPMLVHDVNATGTLVSLLAAVKNRVKRFIYVSSSEVYGSGKTFPMAENHDLAPTTVYGASKLAGELYAISVMRQFGLSVTIVRPFNTYGERSHAQSVYGEVIPRFTIRLLSGLPPIIYGDGKQTRDFIYVADTARGIIKAAESDKLVGQAVNIARGEEVTINNLAKNIAISLRKGVQPLHEAQRPSDVRRHWADITRAKKILGFNPKTSLETGLKHYIAWFRKRYPDTTRFLADTSKPNW